jgi:isocitrate/isopropylmalate dehydrogenase
LANPLSQIRAAGMMLEYLGRKRDADLLEKAIWQALEKERFSISTAGQVEKGAKVVVAALKEELERCYAAAR